MDIYVRYQLLSTFLLSIFGRYLEIYTLALASTHRIWIYFKNANINELRCTVPFLCNIWPVFVFAYRMVIWSVTLPPYTAQGIHLPTSPRADYLFVVTVLVSGQRRCWVWRVTSAKRGDGVTRVTNATAANNTTFVWTEVAIFFLRGELLHRIDNNPCSWFSRRIGPI